MLTGSSKKRGSLSVIKSITAFVLAKYSRHCVLNPLAVVTSFALYATASIPL